MKPANAGEPSNWGRDAGLQHGVTAERAIAESTAAADAQTRLATVVNVNAQPWLNRLAAAIESGIDAFNGAIGAVIVRSARDEFGGLYLRADDSTAAELAITGDFVADEDLRPGLRVYAHSQGRDSVRYFRFVQSADAGGELLLVVNDTPMDPDAAAAALVASWLNALEIRAAL